MLKHLHLENIILVESADIPFENGLNIITGETGAGKSALIHALALVLGERANPGVIRHGADRGVVEAVFSIDSIPEISTILGESGIEIEAEEDLCIRREVSSLGKNRCFIQNCAASLSLVKQIGNLLMGFVSQHSNYLLKEAATHREMADQFGGLQREIDRFRNCWKQFQKAHQDLGQMRQEEAKRVRELEILRHEVEEIENAGLEPGDEEELFEEYARLSNAEELSQTVNAVLCSLDGEEGSANAILKTVKNRFEQIASMDSRMEETAESYSRILLEFQEIVYSLQSYLGKIESNPFRCQELADRLASMNRLKKKYGRSIDEVIAYGAKASERLQLLENIDESIDQLEKEKKILEEQCNAWALDLTCKRKEAAKRLEQAVMEELHSLNMGKCSFEIRITPHPRCEHGDDHVEMYLAPNTGEKSVPLKESASGGELSRVMLALQTTGVRKEKAGSIVFDEIDANIGGETATAVGEKLHHIGSFQQLICITHFPQVAVCAHHHIQIRKEEVNGRTFTQVRVLEGSERKKEIQRMIGGKTALIIPNVVQKLDLG